MAHDELSMGFGAPEFPDEDKNAYAYAERLVYAALQNGIAHFRQRPALWDRILRLLEDDERAKVRAAFAARPPTIRHGYARSTDPFPLVTLTLAAESAWEGYLGELLDTHAPVPAAQYPRRLGRVTGELCEQALDITVLAEHPDMALVLYQWAKYTLRAHDDWFLELGLIEPGFKGGAEIAPDPRYLPETLFARRLTWACRGEDSAVEPMKPPPTRLYANLQGATDAGHRGRIRVQGGGEGAQ